MLTLKRKKFIWIASSDYIPIYIEFFQIIKRCCQMHVQVSSLFKIITIKMFQKEAIFVTFKVCYMRNNLACLGGYPSHLDVADVSNFFFFFDFVFTRSRLMTRLPISNSASLARQLCECLCTNLN